MRYRVLFFAAAMIALLGCDSDEKHQHNSKRGAVTTHDNYMDAVMKCGKLSDTIDVMINAGRLKDVHGAAEEIKKIAEKLPELAQKDLPLEMLKDVNIQAKELEGLFEAIDAAADAEKKEETQKLHAKMNGIILELKKHAGHAKGKHDH